MAAATTLPDAVSPRAEIAAGLTRGLPLVLGYVPVGFTFGLLALNAGLAPLNILAMSLLVYAASSQILAVQLLEGGATPYAVVATTLVVNLRHLLMSSAMARHLTHLRRGELMAFMFQLTDETFAVHSNDYAERTPSRRESFALNASLHLGWMLGTAGAIFTRASPVLLDRLGLDFAPSAMFIAVLALIVRNRVQLAVALGCGIMAVACACAGLGPWGIIISTSVAATGGWGWQTWTKRPSF